ncbi:hypothetical protein JK358_31595 [Nocardia sp. 2]|uniref:DUF1023 domain-containing protein n=1 Tax=Nocardia acididurans TaxID=2802282 RepID=A0ABS1ME87_9NOCA|nr:alpha/beta hydrolase [Nocardia acididurans]MBL1078958.1 hypothetical protein [Nocardia acididurans]
MSGVSVSQVRGWRPMAAATASAGVVEANRAFRAAMAQVGRAVDAALADWRGSGATAVSLRLLDSQLRSNHLGAAALDIADAFADAATLDGVCAAVREVEGEAAANGCVVRDDGTVTAARAETGNGALDSALQACFDAKAMALQARLAALLEVAGETDRRVAVRLADAVAELATLAADPDGGALDPTVAGIVAGTAELPADPKALCALWESLAPADRDALFAFDPSIGNRDGIPAVARDHYNRIALERLSEAAQLRLAALEARHPGWLTGADPPATLAEWYRKDEWDDARRDLEKRLAAYACVAAEADAAAPSDLLLVADAQGHAAIALNNPDTARNIATFVPGTDSAADTLDRGMARSGALLDAAMRADPSARTCVITWYGYDSPAWLGDALQDRFADAGGPVLDRFQDGLRATHDGLPSRNTVIGHSYGSTVIGVAAGAGGAIAADDLIFVGSPGLEVDHVSGLGLHGIPPESNHEHVYATADGADPIPILGPVAHGPSPTDPAFGATVFASSGATLDLPGLRGLPIDPWAHGSYWDAGNPGLTTQGAIIAGTYDR